MRARVIALVCAILLVSAASAFAQPAPRSEGVGVRVFFLLDRVAMNASESFKATLDSSSLTGFGGGVDVTRLWSGVFVRGAFSRLSGDGERVVVVDGEAIPLGFPLEVTMTPLEIGGGWRQAIDPSRRTEAYAGAGWLRLKYQEKSGGTGADATEDLDESFNGMLFFGGVDFDLSKGFMVGFEAQYRSVPDAIGEGGVSREFDETNLGGFAIRFVVGFRK
jgi:opacity protein-like surface antigen